VTLPDDIEVMLGGQPVRNGDVVTPDHAIRNLLDDLLANEPYVLTHGNYRQEYNARRDAIDAAFDRMERS
jgi:hypothetical protein